MRNVYFGEVHMNTQYTAVVKQDGDWWSGWIEEIRGVNCQERTHAELLDSLRVTLSEAIEFKAKQICRDLGVPPIK
jgi:hypothetical protein